MFTRFDQNKIIRFWKWNTIDLSNLHYFKSKYDVSIGMYLQPLSNINYKLFYNVGLKTTGFMDSVECTQLPGTSLFSSVVCGAVFWP